MLTALISIAYLLGAIGMAIVNARWFLRHFNGLPAPALYFLTLLVIISSLTIWPIYSIIWVLYWISKKAKD